MRIRITAMAVACLLTTGTAGSDTFAQPIDAERACNNADTKVKEKAEEYWSAYEETGILRDNAKKELEKALADPKSDQLALLEALKKFWAIRRWVEYELRFEVYDSIDEFEKECRLENRREAFERYSEQLIEEISEKIENILNVMTPSDLRKLEKNHMERK